jgi:hypothetical protein
MGWVTPAIMLGSGIYNYLHNKDKEKEALKLGRQRYNDYYNSPQILAANQHLRDYFAAHGLDTNLLEARLQPRPFNENTQAFKNPGAGTALAGSILDALASTRKPKTTTTTTGTEFAGPPADSILGGASLPSTRVGVGSASRAGVPDATQNDPASIFANIFGQGEGPTPVNDPSSAISSVLKNRLRWNPQTHRFEYIEPEGSVQGL